MPFVVDLLPPSADIEAASALGLAMSERKSKGLFGRKQYEPIEVIARLGLPLRTVTWTPGETTGRCLAFNPQALVSGSIRFDLSSKAPEYDFDSATSEEVFLELCQQWTKSVSEYVPSTLEFAGLITQPDQVAPLLDGEDEVLLVNLEEKADPDGALTQLSEQLELFKNAAAAWADLKQKAYTHRDVLADGIQDQIQAEREAGDKSLEDLNSQVETAISANRGETDAALTAAQEEYQKHRDTLQAELDRFQEGFKTDGQEYWREQIRTAEKSMGENEKWLGRKRQELEDAFRDFERQQNNKIREFKAELEKRIAAIENRLRRLDAAMEGFAKGLERRMTVYEQQPGRVMSATVEISNERCAKAHNAVFHAVRYPGGRWVVFPPQVVGSRGIMGAVSGLFGGLNLPFKAATKLAETLADKLQKLIPGSELEGRLAEANLLQDEAFIPSAKAGLNKLIDQGKLDKKHAGLFATLGANPAGAEAPGESAPAPAEVPAEAPEPEPAAPETPENVEPVQDSDPSAPEA